MSGFWLMKYAVPPLTWFRAFESAARHLSFTNAAAELNLTQSAVSQHVRALEGRLGVVLFERKARGLAITEAGRRLQPSVSGAIGDLARACEMFAPQPAGQTLDIACTMSFALLWLTPRLSSFHAGHPSVHLGVSSTLWPDEYHNATSDLQIRYGIGYQMPAGAIQLFSDVLVPVCIPDMAERVRHQDDLWSLPLIGTVGSSEGWEDWAGHVKATTPPIASHSVDSMALALAFAKAGSGVALVSRTLSIGSIRDGSLVMPVSATAPAKNSYFLTHSIREDRRKSAESFSAWLMDEIACIPD